MSQHSVEYMTQHLNDLEQRVQDIVQQYPFAVHWQIRDIAHDVSIGQHERQIVGAFSTRKVSVLLACLALVKTKRLTLEQPLVIDAALKDGVQAGIMRNLSAGIELSLQDHLAQMMITSDNICTQLVFQAMDDETGDALQWVNDYCANVGMYDTLHREIFPRSAELSWAHSIEQMTVTSAHDQAMLLQRLAQGCCDETAATQLGLTTQLCELAVELMSHLYTPLFGSRVNHGSFIEKNGRGIRGLSHVGLYSDPNEKPIASLAVFAEHVPVELMDGTPGRMRALECFVELGQVLEEYYDEGITVPVAERQVVAPDYWGQELGELVYAVEQGRSWDDDIEFSFSGIGKLFLAVTLDALASTQPDLLAHQLTIGQGHRENADTGSLRHLTGDLRVSISDAMRLIVGSGDGAAVNALLAHLHAVGIDVLDAGRQSVQHLQATSITGLEERSAGEGFLGTTTAADVLQLLREIIDDKPRVMDWMTGVFEPDGLASTLPGYGPHTLPHWTVSGWARIYDQRLDEGRTSVLILDCPDGLRGVVAHAPVGIEDVPSKFGSLGLSVTTNP